MQWAWVNKPISNQHCCGWKQNQLSVGVKSKCTLYRKAVESIGKTLKDIILTPLVIPYCTKFIKVFYPHLSMTGNYFSILKT
jgi:hypothetical protein